MVRAWFMDDSTEDQRLEHQRKPPQFVDIKDLKAMTGVEYVKLNPETYQTDGALEKLKIERGYTYEDEITCSKECLANYEEKHNIVQLL